MGYKITRGAMGGWNVYVVCDDGDLVHVGWFDTRYEAAEYVL